MRLPNSYGSITKLKGNRRKPWMVRVTTHIDYDEDTRKYSQKQKPLGYYSTRQEAMKALADYNNDPYDLDALTVTFDQCCQEVLKEYEGKDQYRQYLNAYKYLAEIKDMPIRSIKAGQMQKCIDSCTNSQQPLIKTLCRKSFEYALRQEYTEKNPAQYLTAVSQKSKIVRELFDREQVEELWTLTEHWWVRMALMLLYTGMRTKELKNVDLVNIDLKNRILTLTEAKNECSVRTIPIHKRVVPLFRQYIDDGGNMYGYAHSSLNKYLGEYHGHRAHDTRHTFATRMREIGTDQLVIKRILGHTPSDLTERIYTHLTDEELIAAVDRLEY